MYMSTSLVFVFFLVQLCLGKMDSNGNIILEPLTLEELGLQRRDSSAINLDSQASIFWGGSSSKGSVVVNVTLETGEDEMILSTDHFAQELKSVTCGSPISLAFTSDGPYRAAISDWDWVNFSNNRTFILIINDQHCYVDGERQPWVVSGARYDDSNFIVNFNASRTTWDQLNVLFTFDWGHFPAPSDSSKGDTKHSKRLEGGKNHHISLASNFDHTLFKNETKSGLDMAILCSNCGTKGGMSIEGHVKLRTIPASIDEAWVKLTPTDLELDLGLSFEISGTLGSGWEKQFDIISIPVEGFKIPLLFTLDLAAKVDAGFSLSGVQGSASISKGIKIKIPNDAHAQYYFIGSEKSNSDGWKPTVEDIPFDATAEITGTLNMYSQIGLDVDLNIGAGIFGGSLGVALKVPDVHFDLTAGYDYRGACNTQDQYFVKLDGGIGADLSIRGWLTEAKKKSLIYTHDLWKNDHLYDFPECCHALHLGPYSSISMVSIAAPSGPGTPLSTIMASYATTTTSSIHYGPNMCIGPHGFPILCEHNQPTAHGKRRVSVLTRTTVTSNEIPKPTLAPGQQSQSWKA